MKRTQRWSLMLSLGLLAVGGASQECLSATTQPHVLSVTASCRVLAANVEKLLAGKPDIEKLTVYVVCREPDWLRLQQKIGFPGTVEAFTYLGQPIILIGPPAFETTIHLGMVLDHELRHVRCGCDLGEPGF